MNNYENPYIRLQTYYSWISRGSYDLDGMSILELHHYTQIPSIRSAWTSLLS